MKLFVFFCVASVGTASISGPALVGTLKAGVPGFFPQASKGEVVSFLPLLSCRASFLHCPVQAFECLAKYQQGVDYDASMIYL